MPQKAFLRGVFPRFHVKAMLLQCNLIAFTM